MNINRIFEILFKNKIKIEKQICKFYETDEDFNNNKKLNFRKYSELFRDKIIYNKNIYWLIE